MSRAIYQLKDLKPHFKDFFIPVAVFSTYYPSLKQTDTQEKVLEELRKHYNTTSGSVVAESTESDKVHILEAIAEEVVYNGNGLQQQLLDLIELPFLKKDSLFLIVKKPVSLDSDTFPHMSAVEVVYLMIKSIGSSFFSPSINPLHARIHSIIEVETPEEYIIYESPNFLANKKA